MYGLQALNPARVLFANFHAVKQVWRPSGGGSIGKHCKTLHLQPRHFSGNSLVKVESPVGKEEWRLQTLAIETSCDDTSVAVLSISANRANSKLRTNVLFHEKVTARSEAYQGIHPLVALHSHQAELGPLVQKAIEHLESKVVQDCTSNDHNTETCKTVRTAPDFVAVTRGPGMRSNLSVGLELAKGLAASWNVPLIGVHHMQAHALTPRLCATLKSKADPDRILYRSDDADEENKTVKWKPDKLRPGFPFLGLLASGGHTMLIDSQSLTNHEVLAETADIAIGDCLDKAARAILPEPDLKVPYGKALEDFAFPSDRPYEYQPPARRQDELERRTTRWGWSLGPPLAESNGREKSSRRMMYSFTGLCSSVVRLMSRRVDEATDSLDVSDTLSPNHSSFSLKERRAMAREVQRLAFEHLASRILLHLDSMTADQKDAISTVVVSGGVASNKFLRHVLRSILDVRGHADIELLFPPPELCTDNALMIAWAGMEMYDAGYENELSIQPLRKWSMDSTAEDGGILGVGGWREGVQRQGTREEAAAEEDAANSRDDQDEHETLP